MFLVIVTSANGAATRFPFRKNEITLGRADGNDLILPADHVSRRHARLVIKDGKFIIVDLKSTHGTFVNGRRLTSPLVIRESDDLRIDEYKLEYRAIDVPAIATNYRAADPIEEALIRAIEDSDEPSRHVYADWLEEHGDHVRAEFLRVQELLAIGTDVERSRHDNRLLELAMTIDVHWRARVAQPSIERCTFELDCPKRWSELEPTDKDGVRFCSACAKPVHYCVSIPEAKAHARNGACVALDLTASRWTGDLAPSWEDLCGSCGADIGPQHTRCPVCGGNARRYATVGRLPTPR
jgi:uncharacterized protein (TIGR02996 family)